MPARFIKNVLKLFTPCRWFLIKRALNGFEFIIRGYIFLILSFFIKKMNFRSWLEFPVLLALQLLPKIGDFLPKPRTLFLLRLRHAAPCSWIVSSPLLEFRAYLRRREICAAKRKSRLLTSSALSDACRFWRTAQLSRSRKSRDRRVCALFARFWLYLTEFQSRCSPLKSIRRAASRFSTIFAAWNRARRNLAGQNCKFENFLLSWADQKNRDELSSVHLIELIFLKFFFNKNGQFSYNLTKI